MTLFLRLTTSVTQFPFLHHIYFMIKIKHTSLFKTSVNQTNLRMHFWLNVLWEKRGCSPTNLWRNSEINPSHRVAGGKITKISVLLWKHSMPFFVCFLIWCYLQWLVFEILMWSMLARFHRENTRLNRWQQPRSVLLDRQHTPFQSPLNTHVLEIFLSVQLVVIVFFYFCFIFFTSNFQTVPQYFLQRKAHIPLRKWYHWNFN